jgi:uncharacterized membrane protein (DUF485 family)
MLRDGAPPISGAGLPAQFGAQVVEKSRWTGFLTLVVLVLSYRMILVIAFISR